MNLPLSFSPLTHTSSKDDAEALFGSQLAPSRITTAEKESSFGVAMNGVTIGDTVVSAIHHQTDYEIDCGDIDSGDSVLFGYCLGASSSTRFQGRELSANQHGVIITRHSNVSHRRGSDSYELIIKCSKQSLINRLQTVLDRHISRDLVFAESINMDTPAGKQIARTMAYVLSTLDNNPEALDSSVTAASMEDLLTSTMLSLPHSHSQELDNNRTLAAAPAVVSKAEAYLEANACRAISMNDVLEQAGCSRNTLFKNFRKFRGYTPWEFLTTRRLELVHHRLLNPCPQDTVTSLALELGFTHMGRFSQIYRERYGERPSETLRRNAC